MKKYYIIYNVMVNKQRQYTCRIGEANKNSYISINRTQILVFWQPHVDLQSVNLSFWQRNSCEYACCLCFKICVKNNFMSRALIC